MKKHRIAAILPAIFLFLLLPLAIDASTGDSNIDSGGGGMGSGTSESYWSSGNDGVRVTVVRADSHEAVTTPIDLTNKNPPASLFHFGKVSKLEYRSGDDLSPIEGGYDFKNPVQILPLIIPSDSGGNNIDAIRSYFTDEQVIRAIADVTEMEFDILIGGQFKLFLEPIAFFKFEGVDVGMTATEAALYDEILSGGLRGKMLSLSHKNLPLAMFLEIPDMGYPAWSGSRTSPASNADIKSSLGLGIVRFEEFPEELVLDTYDYEYRVNTEVVTSVMVSGGQSDPGLGPDNAVNVTFVINGVSHKVSNVYYPSGDSQLAWVRWTTPAEPQDMEIAVRVSGPGTAQGVINVKIVDLNQNPPPNPVADDRNDGFSQAPVPDRPQTTTANWGVWRPWWYSYWVWHSNGRGGGYWCDHGWWEFTFDRYSASLSAGMQIRQDNHNPTASGRVMKSGYGVTQTVTAGVSSTQSSAVTPAQNAVSYFPEFGYEQFWRLLDRISGGYGAQFQFKPNVYSTYGSRVHFTPVWMPDGEYTVNTWLIDCWTPVGMLSMNLADSLSILGSVWDDWHIAPLRP